MMIENMMQVYFFDKVKLYSCVEEFVQASELFTQLNN